MEKGFVFHEYALSTMENIDFGTNFTNWTNSNISRDNSDIV